MAHVVVTAAAGAAAACARMQETAVVVLQVVVRIVMMVHQHELASQHGIVRGHTAAGVHRGLVVLVALAPVLTPFLLDGGGDANCTRLGRRVPKNLLRLLFGVVGAGALHQKGTGPTVGSTRTATTAARATARTSPAHLVRRRHHVVVHVVHVLVRVIARAIVVVVVVVLVVVVEFVAKVRRHGSAQRSPATTATAAAHHQHLHVLDALLLAPGGRGGEY